MIASQDKKYRKYLFLILLDLLANCRLQDFGMQAKSIMVAVNNDSREDFH
jgi:hypothetical protein